MSWNHCKYEYRRLQFFVAEGVPFAAFNISKNYATARSYTIGKNVSGMFVKKVYMASILQVLDAASLNQQFSASNKLMQVATIPQMQIENDLQWTGISPRNSLSIRLDNGVNEIEFADEELKFTNDGTNIVLTIGANFAQSGVPVLAVDAQTLYEVAIVIGYPINQ